MIRVLYNFSFYIVKPDLVKTRKLKLVNNDQNVHRSPNRDMQLDAIKDLNIVITKEPDKRHCSKNVAIYRITKAAV